PERETKEQEITIQAVKAWLQTHNKWLLILDNADEPDRFIPFLPPSGGGHLLVTTRAADLSDLGMGFAHSLVVETLTPEQGALFLLRRAGLLALKAELGQAMPQDQTLALQIHHELGGLPLALDQAGAYLKATGNDLATYQQIYQKH